MMMMMMMLFLLLYVSLNPVSLLFSIQVDLQPADLAVVESKNQSRSYICPQLPTRVGAYIFRLTIAVKSSFSLGLPGRSRKAGGVSHDRRSKGSGWNGGLWCISFWLSCSPAAPLALSFILSPDLLLSPVSKTHGSSGHRGNFKSLFREPQEGAIMIFYES